MPIIDALAPVAVLIALGFAFRRTGFIDDAGWAAIERGVYFVFFPALLFLELARADLDGEAVLRFGGVLLATQLLMAAAAALARRRLAIPGPTYTSLLQCVVRWNSYVAVAMAPLLFGRAGVPLAAVAIAVMVPAANVLSVLALARHGSGGAPGLLAMARVLAGNPLILACLLGLAVNLAGLGLPPLVAEPLAMLARATLALGLLAVGAGLLPRAVLGRPLLVLLAAALKLLVKPLVGIGLGWLAGLEGTALGMVALVCGVPTATSSYILARLLGGDAALMAGLITATTLLAFLTLPPMLALAG
jgi:malonate transporter